MTIPDPLDGIMLPQSYIFAPQSSSVSMLITDGRQVTGEGQTTGIRLDDPAVYTVTVAWDGPGHIRVRLRRWTAPTVNRVVATVPDGDRNHQRMTTFQATSQYVHTFLYLELLDHGLSDSELTDYSAAVSIYPIALSS